MAGGFINWHWLADKGRRMQTSDLQVIANQLLVLRSETGSNPTGEPPQQLQGHLLPLEKRTRSFRFTASMQRPVAEYRWGTALAGTWVLPYWQEVPQLDGVTPGCPAEGESFAGVLMSRDQGKTWRRSDRIKMDRAFGESWLIEGSLAELGNSSLLQVFRTHIGTLYSSVSPDGGNSWRPAAPFGLPNPNSKPNIIRLEVG